MDLFHVKNQECETNSDCSEGQRCRNNFCTRRTNFPKPPPPDIPDIDVEENNVVLRRNIKKLPFAI